MHAPDDPRQAQTVPVHPERTRDPSTLRWYLGRSLADAPAVHRPLQRLVDDGVLAGYDLGPLDVTTRLAPGRAWAQEAAGVRAAVQDAVRRHEQHWDGAGARHRDDVIAEVARDVLATLVSPVAASHGGTIQLLDVSDGTITVRLRGACHGCPASARTLHGLLERGIAGRLPGAAIVVDAE